MGPSLGQNVLTYKSPLQKRKGLLRYHLEPIVLHTERMTDKRTDRHKLIFPTISEHGG